MTVSAVAANGDAGVGDGRGGVGWLVGLAGEMDSGGLQAIKREVMSLRDCHWSIRFLASRCLSSKQVRDNFLIGSACLFVWACVCVCVCAERVACCVLLVCVCACASPPLFLLLWQGG